VDKEVHLALARLTGDPVFVSPHHTVHDIVNECHMTNLLMNDRELLENFTDLKDIITAIKEGRVDDARVLARRHLLRFNQPNAVEATPKQTAPTSLEGSCKGQGE
jgi:DNA-binding FadR family transcriptional regulator